ncbi:unnamed protein product, partial [Meganyctiphanes norvegica]
MYYISHTGEQTVDPGTRVRLDAAFKKLQASASKSLLKKYLTPSVFSMLKEKKTKLGATLLDVIQSGVENPKSSVGVYAPDAEAYDLFSPLFIPIINDYHLGFGSWQKHPDTDYGDMRNLVDLDPFGRYIISTRVRVARSLHDFPFNPILSEDDYHQIEDLVSNALYGLTGEFEGRYLPLVGMSREIIKKLRDEHLLFKNCDKFMEAAGSCHYWPCGRGMYLNEKKSFLVWVNEEDHLRIISMDMGGDLGEIYRRLVRGMEQIEKHILFSHHERLGYLNFCPTNLGTSLRASVHIRLPHLASDRSVLEEVASRYNLQIRGTRGEHTDVEGGIYDISNKRRMGLTEWQTLEEMQRGILELIRLDSKLSRRQQVL